jgi:ribonuclease BN (tRNA processing enzyme)
MRVTVVGCGDAFGSGGRYNTCFHIQTGQATLLFDCGASSLVAFKSHGIDHNAVDGIILSHLHGDHFGGLPFLLLDAQFLARRERPLTIAGPPGTRARLDAAIEIFFPKATQTKWRFDWRVVEIEIGKATEVVGHLVQTTEVIHQSGAPSTALRLYDGKTLLAYSGDTEWTDALIGAARNANLFICECYGYAGRINGHLTWEILKARLPELNARQIMITHMNPSMLARLDEARAAGVLIAEDGLVIDI